MLPKIENKNKTFLRSTNFIIELDLGTFPFNIVTIVTKSNNGSIDEAATTAKRARKLDWALSWGGFEELVTVVAFDTHCSYLTRVAAEKIKFC